MTRSPVLRRRSRPAVEPLERRDLLAGIPFNFILDDPQGLFASFPMLLPNLQATGQILSGVLGGRGSLEVVVRPNNSIPRASGGTVSVQVVEQAGGLTIVEHGTITEARTGVDPNGSLPDIQVEFNTQSYLPTAWFDPSGAARTEPIPPNRLDFISVALHEITHAFGFQGYRQITGPSYGSFATVFRSTYDRRTEFGLGGNPSVLYFDGPRAVAAYGGPVPLTSVGPSHFLTSQNFFHVGNPVGLPGSDLIPDLMNGVVFNLGTRYAPTPLDLAILADLGWTSPSRLQFSGVPASVNEGAGAATLTVTRTDGGFGAVAVTFATVAGGDATPGADFTPVSGTLSWADGDTAPKTFTVPILDDTLSEGAETVHVELRDPTGTAMLGTPSLAVVTIVDNDPAMLQVSALTMTNSGFVVQFNQPIDPSVLNLYDAEGGGLGPADVVLQAAGSGPPVAGSLLVSSDHTSVTFLATGDVLPAGLYLATLRGAGDGFRTAGGALLDGDGDGVPGGNHVASFTVPSSPAVVVSVPDFVRGPGQPVHVPATATGLPLRLSEGSGVTSVSVVLAYNPQLLAITAAAPGAAVPAGATVSLDTSTPGQAAITLTSPTALPDGPIDFVVLTARVPDAAGASYTAKQLLNLSEVRLNGGAIPARDDDGIHLVAYFGDTTGNGSYSAVDAQRALRAAVGLDAGFLAYQLADPLLIADVTGNGTLNATDATRILQAALGIGQDSVPPLPDDPPAIAPTGPDPLLYFPRSARGRRGRTVVVPLWLGPSDGLESADLSVSFDRGRLDVVEVRRGGLTADFDLFAAHVDAAAGTIRAGLARSAGPVQGRGPGSVIEVVFRIRADAPAGYALINLRRHVMGNGTQLNEGGLDLNPDPSDEEGDVLDGLLLVGRARKRGAAVDAVFSERG